MSNSGLLTLIERAARRGTPSTPRSGGVPLRPVPDRAAGEPGDSAMGGGPEVVSSRLAVDPASRHYRPKVEGAVGREFQGSAPRTVALGMESTRYVQVGTPPPQRAQRAAYVPGNIGLDPSDFVEFTRTVLIPNE